MPYSRHGQIRQQAFPLWQGPASLIQSDAVTGYAMTGYTALTLTASTGFPGYWESRKVYAPVHEVEQPYVILRAGAWDGFASSRLIRTLGDATPFSVPVRFVKIPLTILYDWFARFQQISVSFLPHDEDVLKRQAVEMSVRVEYYPSATERIWVAPLEPDLTRLWFAVWDEMSALLKQEEPIAYELIEEYFGRDDIDTSGYDHQGYQPEGFPFPQAGP